MSFYLLLLWNSRSPLGWSSDASGWERLGGRVVRGRQQTDRRGVGGQASAQRLVIGLVGLI